MAFDQIIFYEVMEWPQLDAFNSPAIDFAFLKSTIQQKRTIVQHDDPFLFVSFSFFFFCYQPNPALRRLYTS